MALELEQARPVRVCPSCARTWSSVCSGATFSCPETWCWTISLQVMLARARGRPGAGRSGCRRRRRPSSPPADRRTRRSSSIWGWWSGFSAGQTSGYRQRFSGAGALGQLLAALEAVHVGGRAAQVLDVAFEAGQAGQRLRLGQDRTPGCASAPCALRARRWRRSCTRRSSRGGW